MLLVSRLLQRWFVSRRSKSGGGKRIRDSSELFLIRKVDGSRRNASTDAVQTVALRQARDKSLPVLTPNRSRWEQQGELFWYADLAELQTSRVGKFFGARSRVGREGCIGQNYGPSVTGA